MMNAISEVSSRSLVIAGFAAGISMIISLLLITASVTGWPHHMFSFEQDAPETLPRDVKIAGWAAFDHDSYVPGQPIRYRARILYRDDEVVPDLDQFVNSVIFSPLEKRESFVSGRRMAGNVREYVLEYILQGVEVEPHARYQLDPVVLFYKMTDGSARNLQSLRIPTPAVYFTGHYPMDVSTIPLKPLKREVDDLYGVRQSVIATTGGILAFLGLFLLWQYGRRRKVDELSGTEVLWREYHDINRSSADMRNRLLKFEGIITRLLQLRAGMTPTAFWTDAAPEDAYWRDFAEVMRRKLLGAYQPGEIDREEVDAVAHGLDQAFSDLVQQDRLKIEQQPTFMRRLVLQPRVLAYSGTSLALAIVMFSLSAMPELWAAPDVILYNDVVIGLSSETPLIEESLPLEEVGGQSDNLLVKAAAYYNAGTIRAHLRPSEFPPMLEAELLEVVFQEKLTLDEYIDDEASAEMLFASAGWLLKAREDLQEAVRADPSDEDIIRNLELVIKRHKAVVAAIDSLFEAMENADIKAKTKLETMVDVLNLEWPDEVEEKDDEKATSTYKISERF